MKGVYLYDNELLELWAFLLQRKDEICDYIKSHNLSFVEAASLLAACEKIEKEMKGDEKNDL